MLRPFESYLHPVKRLLPLWEGGPSASAVPSPFPPSALGLPLSSLWRLLFREKWEPLSAFVLAPLDDCDFTVRAWQEYVLLSPGFRA